MRALLKARVTIETSARTTYTHPHTRMHRFGRTVWRLVAIGSSSAEVEAERRRRKKKRGAPDGGAQRHLFRPLVREGAGGPVQPAADADVRAAKDTSSTRDA